MTCRQKGMDDLKNWNSHSAGYPESRVRICRINLMSEKERRAALVAARFFSSTHYQRRTVALRPADWQPPWHGTLFYALVVMLTRKLQTSDSSAAMAYYRTLVYLVASLTLSPLAALVGRPPNAHASIAFLLRYWTMPTTLDLAIMVALA
jgi:hypothetical protein